MQEGEVLLELGDEHLERRRGVIERDEDVAPPRSYTERLQPTRFEIEPLGFLHVGRPNEPSLQVVEPTVVGARKLLGVALARRDLDAAMSADVREGVELAVLVARDDDRLADDVEGQVVARFLELLLTPDEEPILHVHVLFLEGEHLRRRVHVAGRMFRPLDWLAQGVEALANRWWRDIGNRHWIVLLRPHRRTLRLRYPA